MKILQIHNQYVFPGGEDSVADTEATMLRANGHEVVLFRKDNAGLERASLLGRFKFLCGEFLYSRAVYNELTEVLQKERPQVVHVHNPFYMMTPAAYEACFDAGVPVVQTLHNYRFLCPAATFFRQGHVCETCLSGDLGPAVRHGCWKGSCVATFFLVRLLKEYRRRRILDRISRCIVLSAFSYRKFVEAGWPKEKLVVKRNVLSHDPGRADGEREPFALYVGTLQDYKGVKTLVAAWQHLQDIPLKIIGSGPLENVLRAEARGPVEFLGQRPQEDVRAHMHRASVLVVPSECYETFSRVILEAYACGLPVVASRLGAMAEIVREGTTGLLFEPGSSRDLADKVRAMFSGEETRRLCAREARACYEAEYAAEDNCRQLVRIYEEAG